MCGVDETSADVDGQVWTADDETHPLVVTVAYMVGSFTIHVVKQLPGGNKMCYDLF